MLNDITSSSGVASRTNLTYVFPSNNLQGTGPANGTNDTSSMNGAVEPNAAQAIHAGSDSVESGPIGGLQDTSSFNNVSDLTLPTGTNYISALMANRGKATGTPTLF